MSEKIDTGGYAFPFSPTGSDSEQNGLTLLDFFAAKAMRAVLECGFESKKGFEITAQISYELAQAMVAEKRRIEGGV